MSWLKVGQTSDGREMWVRMEVRLALDWSGMMEKGQVETDVAGEVEIGSHL